MDHNFRNYFQFSKEINNFQKINELFKYIRTHFPRHLSRADLPVDNSWEKELVFPKRNFEPAPPRPKLQTPSWVQLSRDIPEIALSTFPDLHFVLSLLYRHDLCMVPISLLFCSAISILPRGDSRSHKLSNLFDKLQFLN